MRTASDRGGVWQRLLIFFVVVVAVLVAIDRIGDAVAERLTADTIQSNQHLPKRPDVNITGFPFLTQLAAGKFGKVIISDTDVPVGGASGVRLSMIRVTLHHVRVSRDLSSVRADTAAAVATMNYDELGRVLGGVRIRYDGGGRITASKSIEVLGHHFSGEISARPQFTHGALSFGETQIRGVNELIPAAAELLQNVFAVHLPLHGIPFDVRVRSLYADPAGLHLALIGRNLVFSH
jgi:hypothetical protein